MSPPVANTRATLLGLVRQVKPTPPPTPPRIQGGESAKASFTWEDEPEIDTDGARLSLL